MVFRGTKVGLKQHSTKGGLKFRVFHTKLF